MLGITPSITAFVLIVTSVTGACVGSFLNCLSWRIVAGESVLKGRSHCTTCNHTLEALDLLPILSYIHLRGKCRYCGEKISPRYAAVEVFTAVMFVSLALRFDVTPELAKFILLSSILLSLSLVDFDNETIPDGFIIAGIVLFLAFSPFGELSLPKTLLNGLIGGLSISLPLLLLVLLADKVLKRDTMGGGDIKLIFMIGLFFDWKLNLLLIIISCVTGILVALLLGKAKPGTPFPFGPAISLSAVIVMLFGSGILDWYLGLMKL